jgi:hypothetical protein
MRGIFVSLPQHDQPSIHPHPSTIDRRRPCRTYGTLKYLQSLQSACSFAQNERRNEKRQTILEKKQKDNQDESNIKCHPTCEAINSNHWNGFRRCVQSHTKTIQTPLLSLLQTLFRITLVFLFDH